MPTLTRTTRSKVGETATKERDTNVRILTQTHGRYRQAHQESPRRSTSDASSSSSEVECNQRASSPEIIDLLDVPSNPTYPRGTTMMDFWESSIIAERRNKTHKKTKDYLVEALPVWRRASVDGGPEPDHIEEWEAMKKDSGFHLESEKYDFVVQRMHPRFERWTAADETFARELESRMRIQRNEERNRDKAMEMLGYLIERIVKEVDAEARSWLLDHWGDVFTNTKDVTSGVVTTPREACARGWQLMRNTSRKDRQDIGKAILFRKGTSVCDLWTVAFCIALLPPDDIRAAWKEKGIKDRPKRYRSAITTFLGAYHDDGIHNEESFIYVLRTYYTLTEMLKQTAVEEDHGDEYHNSIYDNSSEYDSDVQGDDGDNTDVIKQGSEGPSSDHNGNASSSDDEDDEDWEPETDETRTQVLEQATRKEAEGAVPGKRVTRGQKRTRKDALGKGDGSSLQYSTEAGEDSGHKKTKN